MKYGFSDRMGQFLRSLSIQGSWNFPRMQGLGLLYSLLPWLRKTRGSGFKEACHRHLGYFNTNPYMSTYVLGVVSRLEEEGQSEDSIKARNNLMGPLGAMGDGYYWATLLPVSVMAALAISFYRPAAAPVFFLLIYNIIHIRNRWSYLNRGYMNAHSPLEEAARLSGGTVQRVMDLLAAPLAGLILGLAAFGTGTPGTTLLLFAAALLLYRRKLRALTVFAILVILGVLMGLLGTGARIPWSA